MLNKAKKEFIEYMIEELRSFEEGESQPVSKDKGICAWFHEEMRFRYSENMDEEFLWPIFRSWNKFSGDIDYPVPSPDPDFRAEFYFLWDVETKWGESEYADSRRELCGHMADEFEYWLENS